MLGQEGSPIFDKHGKLMGILDYSVTTNMKTHPHTVGIKIDSLLPFLKQHLPNTFNPPSTLTKKYFFSIK